MIRESFTSVSIVYKYARSKAVIYIAMLMASSCLTPFSIIVMQRLIDSIGRYLEAKEQLSAVSLGIGFAC